MAQVLKGGSHGCYKVLAALVGSDGVAYGQAGSGITAGANSNAYVMDHPVSANITIPDRTTIDFTGGDTWIQSFQYGINSLGSFDFQLEDTDPVMTALCNGSLVDQTTNDEWTQYTENILAAAIPQMALIIIHRVQSTDLDTFGATKYINTIIPRCWVAPKGVGGINYQAKSASTFQVTPTGAGRKINGEDIGSEIQAANNQLAWYHIISDYPLNMVTGKVDASPFDLVSAYKPISTVVGTATSSKNRIVQWVGGVATVGVADSVTLATGTAAVGTALSISAGDILTFLHETAFERVA